MNLQLTILQVMIPKNFVACESPDEFSSECHNYDL